MTPEDKKTATMMIVGVVGLILFTVALAIF